MLHRRWLGGMLLVAGLVAGRTAACGGDLTLAGEVHGGLSPMRGMHTATEEACREFSS